MEARRAAIVEAQLVSSGWSKEQARAAASQGPEAVAALRAGEAFPITSSLNMVDIAPLIEPGPVPTSAMATSACAVPASAEAPAVDISWMFPNPDSACASADPTPLVAPAVDGSWMSWMFSDPTSVYPSTPREVVSSAPIVDIGWMFSNSEDNSTLSDEAMAQEVGMEYANEVGIAVEAFSCECCLEDVPAMTGVQLSPGVEGCDHVLCPECFKRLISGQIQNKEACVCPLCPATRPSVVPSWLVRRVLGDEMAMQASEIEQIHLDKTDGGQLRLWQCPTPDCTNRQVVDANWDPQQVVDGQRIVDCEVCKKRICVRCNVEEHQGFTCQQFKEWREANDSTEQSYANMMQQGLIKPCPNCAAPILKTEGCNFMTCPTCNDPDRMCWQTGKKRYGRHGCGGGHNCH